MPSIIHGMWGVESERRRKAGRKESKRTNIYESKRRRKAGRKEKNIRSHKQDIILKPDICSELKVLNLIPNNMKHTHIKNKQKSSL